MNGFRFTTSWDDGHPLDRRIAELLDSHGLSGTFYIPVRNLEGRTVMSGREIRNLDAAFEIGAHTKDHLYLTRLTPNVVYEQVQVGKSILEDTLGHSVSGFAYPGGRHSSRIRATVAQAGFTYARTTENFRTDRRGDRYRIPTTLQFYPHRPATYLRNMIFRGHRLTRSLLFLRALASEDVFVLMRAALRDAQLGGGVFHLWGHSWEIEELDLWQPLEAFLAHAAREIGPGDAVSNAELAACPTDWAPS